jgi:AmmeMemoRadiSam system protein B/AmmeMemoRadiSam system protein A
MYGFLFGIAVFGSHGSLLEATEHKVRAAGVAGSFYPAGAAELMGMMDGYLAEVGAARIDDSILAVVAPHAGYQYSGPVAAWTYAALEGRKYARVVVISPSHFDAFGFTSVYDGDAYTTPLGTIHVDKEFAKHLAGMQPSIRLSERGHAPRGRDVEHAIEVQLPWLQRVLGEFTVVPVMMGDQSYESSRALGVSLAKLIAKEDAGSTLIVASSDLSHYHEYNDAVKLDHKMLDALRLWDYFSMSRNFEERVWEACGGAPIVAAMIAAEREGARQARLMHYANSGDVTGDKSHVVGYGAVALVKGSRTDAGDERLSLSEGDKDELIALARASVEHAVREHRAYDPPAPLQPALNREIGAFVTLKEGGVLRGCIGYTSASRPLYETIRDTATLAAFGDPRFGAVNSDEVSKLEYEISVLSPLRRVLDVQEIEVGRHGLLIKNGGREGILLPQVPLEQHWGRAMFLEQTCVKAGLPEQCWKDEETDIFSFTADVFGEHRATAK